jgi:hypothetical protein
LKVREAARPSASETKKKPSHHSAGDEHEIEYDLAK